MREILFRGKRKDNRKWIEGDLIQLDSIVCIAAKDMWARATEDNNEAIELQCAEIIQTTIGEFTGVTDKNGVKIFEGDVCRLDSGILVGVAVMGGLGAFGFRIPCMGIKIPMIHFTDNQISLGQCYKKIKIIGNIYDNPELSES